MPNLPLRTPAALSSRTTAPKPRSRGRKLLALTSLSLAGLIAGLLSGCSNLSQAANTVVPAVESYTDVTGNWRFTSGGSAQMDVAGALAVEGSQLSGRLHAMGGSCASGTGASFPVSGAIDSSGHVALSGEDDAAHTFQVAGLLAPDHHSLIEPAITVTGTCAGSKVVSAKTSGGSTGQQYQSVTGNYAGAFTDSDGDSLSVNASLTQPTTPDGNGVYHLTGTATFASVPCLGSPVVTSSTVTGDQISATYTDSNTGATVVGSGTFSSDAQTLTISTWTLSGSCGAASGSGLLTHQ